MILPEVIEGDGMRLAESKAVEVTGRQRHALIALNLAPCEPTVNIDAHSSCPGSSDASQTRLLRLSLAKKGKLIPSGAPDRYRSSSTMPKLFGGTNMAIVIWRDNSDGKVIRCRTQRLDGLAAAETCAANGRSPLGNRVRLGSRLSLIRFG